MSSSKGPLKAENIMAWHCSGQAVAESVDTVDTANQGFHCCGKGSVWLTYHVSSLPFVNALNVDLFRAGWPRQARAAKVSPSGVRPFVGQVQPCYRLRRQCFSRRIFGLPTVEDPAAQFLPLSFATVSMQVSWKQEGLRHQV